MKDSLPIKLEMMCAFDGDTPYADAALEFAVDVSEVYASLEQRAAEVSASTETNGQLLSTQEKANLREHNDRYTSIYQAIVELKIMEANALVAASDLAEGTITEQQALSFFPVAFVDLSSPNGERVSKRRQAIAEQERARMKVQKSDDMFIHPFYRSGSLGDILYGGVGHSDGPELRTDPRRVASGRARTRLNAGSGMSSFQAEGAFINATSDTHGGKSRRPGKNGGFYVGKSGRSVRKK